MVHLRAISAVPGRAVDDFNDPTSDGFISIPELLNMTYVALQALAAYLLVKETAE